LVFEQKKSNQHERDAVLSNHDHIIARRK